MDDAVRQTLARRAYPPALRRIVGELLAATTLLSTALRFDGRLAVQLRGDGLLPLLVVDCDPELHLRATAQWDDAASTLPPDASLAALAGGSGHGRLSIVFDPADGGAVHQGIVALEAASIGELIEHYLRTSEQLESRLQVATDERGASGLLVHRVAETDDATWQRVTTALAAISPAQLRSHLTAETLLAECFPEDDLRIFAARPIHAGCGCSADRAARALRHLGPAEVDSILAEQGKVTVSCEFCGRQYEYDRDGARDLFTADCDAGRPSASAVS